MRKRLSVLAALLLVVCLAGCAKGKALPEGMEEERVLLAGKEIVALLIDGDYVAVHERLREDVREGTTPEKIEALMHSATEKLGESKKISDTLVTGVTGGENPHGIAVIYYDYEKKAAVFRIAFDPQMELIGLEIKKK